jgi:F-type H+-transporting ATPase subunit alpha
MPVEEQILSLFAGTTGRLDNVPVDDVARYERELIQFFRSSHADLLDRILTERQESTRQLNEDLDKALRAAIDEFEQRVWQPTSTEAAAAG